MSQHDRSIQKQRPVVCRVAAITPAQIAGFEAHRLRKGESAEHCDRTKKNRRLFGGEDWAAQALLLIERMKRQNHLIEAQTAKKRNRMKQLDAILERGAQDPWDARAEGPMREIILTAHQDWFAEAEGWPKVDGRNAREVAFERTAIAWLKATFGDDLVHARADHDETTYHIHAVILPAKKMIKRPKGAIKAGLPPVAMIPGEDLFTHQGKFCKVQMVPSKHPLLRNYEKLQDAVGLAFAPIGLTRGDRHWGATKQALSEGRTPDPRPRHQSAHSWRAEQEARIEREKAAFDERMKAETAALEARKRDVAKETEAQLCLQDDLTLRKISLDAKQKAIDADRRHADEDAAWLKKDKTALDERERDLEEKTRSAEERARQAEAARRSAEAVLAVADAIACGSIDPEKADLASARKTSRLMPEIADPIDAEPEAASSAFARLRKAYGAMRDRARADIEPTLRRMEVIGTAWAELQQRVERKVKDGAMTKGLYAALFGRLTDTQRDAFERAEDEARQIRNRFDKGEER